MAIIYIIIHSRFHNFNLIYFNLILKFVFKEVFENGVLLEVGFVLIQFYLYTPYRIYRCIGTRANIGQYASYLNDIQKSPFNNSLSLCFAFLLVLIHPLALIYCLFLGMIIYIVFALFSENSIGM